MPGRRIFTADSPHRLLTSASLSTVPRPARGTLDPGRLDRVRDFIETNLGEDLTIEALAKEACLSPFHFARAFKAATGWRRTATARKAPRGSGTALRVRIAPARRRGLGGRRRSARHRHVRRPQQRLRVHSTRWQPNRTSAGPTTDARGTPPGTPTALSAGTTKAHSWSPGGHPVRDCPLRAEMHRLGIQCDRIPTEELRAEPLDPVTLGVVPDRRDRQHHRSRPDRPRHQELCRHPHLKDALQASRTTPWNSALTALRAVEQHSAWTSPPTNPDSVRLHRPLQFPSLVDPIVTTP